MTESLSNAEDFGLEDPIVLAAATRLSPHLFASLRIATTVDRSIFPIDSISGLDKALSSIANEGESFSFPGVAITPQIARDEFPSELLPIADPIDFLRKVYQAINISHTNSSSALLKHARSGKQITASHPLPEGLV
jgi:hypothetical protein